ncbi:MAG: hypothetical protein ACHP7K_03640 [Actinomycetales bacterium]
MATTSGDAAARKRKPAASDMEPEAYEAAVRNMHRSLAAVRPAVAALTVSVSPEMVLGVQSTENAWRDMEAEFGFLTGSQVAELLGSHARGRSSYAADKRKAGQLIGIKRRNALLYPGFQFDGAAGRIRAVVPSLIAVIREHHRDEEDLAQWLCDPSGYFGGGRPVDYLSKPAKVLAAAQDHYGVEW